MNTFLDTVAASLHAEFKGNLSNVTIVFPNKRASLFFNRALATFQTPVWSPRYITISELFRSCSQNIEIADHIDLIITLHKVYCNITGSEESLDQFYGWGEMMLADFDDIDKHMADASQIFTLMENIHEFDDVDYLSEHQKAELQRFFSNFTESHNTELKKNFLKLWKNFGDIYATFKKVLFEKGVAYEGMLYRSVIESLTSQDKPFTIHHSPFTSESRYVFIGFNYITPVEQKLFDYLRKENGALFFQDDASSEPLPVTYLSSPTNDLQARYIAQWLTPERIAAGRKTAIVLADETLLETVLHCLPPSVEHVNITVGYPLAKSPISSMVRQYCNLLQHKSFTLHNINAVLRHPYMKLVSGKTMELHDSLNEQSLYYPTMEDLALDENLKEFFSPTDDIISRLKWLVEVIAHSEEINDDFFHESVFRMYCILERLYDINQETPLSSSLFNNLLTQIIKTTTIPFHGEPLQGIQIMGVLETRNLDFDHVLLLSCNEGFMPAHVNDTSFIPYSVRKAYSLTTIDNKVAIYDYYFKHLLKRCPDATLVYSDSTTDGKMSEMSRFMLQYLAEHANLVTHRILTPALQAEESSIQPLEKAHLSLPITLSPSALGRYLRCPMSFYFNKVQGISDMEESDEEEMDARTFGNIFHKAAEILYKQYKGRSVPKSFYDEFKTNRGNVMLESIVDEAFRIELFNMKDSNRKMPKLGGLQVINREMILRFMHNLVSYDAKVPSLTILGLEMPIKEEIFPGIYITGIIDRLDKVVIDGKEYIRVIDYKTGRMGGRSNRLKLSGVEDIFLPESIKNHSDYFLQALLYCNMLSCTADAEKKRIVQDLPLQPNLFYVQHMNDEAYAPNLMFNNGAILDARQYSEPFMQGIKKLVDEILDKENVFPRTEDAVRCKACGYRELCNINNNNID